MLADEVRERGYTWPYIFSLVDSSKVLRSWHSSKGNRGGRGKCDQGEKPQTLRHRVAFLTHPPFQVYLWSW